jgi:hypothetical protein
VGRAAGTGYSRTTDPEEDLMTEPSNAAQEPVDEAAASSASVGGDVDQPGGGRTGGETSVDEAMGAEDESPE